MRARGNANPLSGLFLIRYSLQATGHFTHDARYTRGVHARLLKPLMRGVFC